MKHYYYYHNKLSYTNYNLYCFLKMTSLQLFSNYFIFRWSCDSSSDTCTSEISGAQTLTDTNHCLLFLIFYSLKHFIVISFLIMCPYKYI